MGNCFADNGVFFNMIGYRTSDYSGNYHGLCQCDNCKRLFKEFANMELPRTANRNNPAYRKYGEFTRMMTDRQFRRVNEFLKAKRPDLAICTYTSAGVDVILKESNRPLGQGPYHDTELAKWTLLTCGERQLASNQCKALDSYVKNGGKLLITQKVPKALQCFGPVTLESTRPTEKGSYIRIRPEDRRRFNRPVLDKLDLVFLSGDFNVYETEGRVDGLLRLIPQDMFGPPEKCYYRQVSDHPALIYNKYGKGAVACFTFDIGAHYQAQCHQGHANLVMGAIDNVLDLERRLEVETSPLVEVTHRTSRDGTFEWVGLFNHSGQLNNALHAPIPVDDIRISIIPFKPIKAARLLSNGKKLRISKRKNRISMTVPTLKHYDIVLLEYE